MDQNEVINRMLARMNYATLYDFFSLWFEVVDKKGLADSEIRQRIHLCMDTMVEKNLIIKCDEIAQVRGGGQVVRLTPRGFEIKQNGGWIRYIKNSKGTFWSKSIYWATHINTMGDAISKAVIVIGLLCAGFMYLVPAKVAVAPVDEKGILEDSQSETQLLSDSIPQSPSKGKVK